MAALDDMVGVVVFFTVIAVVARNVSGTAMPVWMIPVMIFLPLIIGAAAGIPAGFLLKKNRGKAATLAILIRNDIMYCRNRLSMQYISDVLTRAELYADGNGIFSGVFKYRF
jgi:hypothetical protein